MGKFEDGEKQIVPAKDVSGIGDIAQKTWTPDNIRELTKGTGSEVVVTDKPPTDVMAMKEKLAADPGAALQATLDRTARIEEAIKSGDKAALLRYAEEAAKDFDTYAKPLQKLVAFNTNALMKHQDKSNGFEIYDSSRTV